MLFVCNDYGKISLRFCSVAFFFFIIFLLTVFYFIRNWCAAGTGRGEIELGVSRSINSIARRMDCGRFVNRFDRRLWHGPQRCKSFRRPAMLKEERLQ